MFVLFIWLLYALIGLSLIPWFGRTLEKNPTKSDITLATLLGMIWPMGVLIELSVDGLPDFIVAFFKDTFGKIHLSHKQRRLSYAKYVTGRHWNELR